MWRTQPPDDGAGADGDMQDRDAPVFHHKPSVIESFANMTLEGTTNNIIDRLLLERAARENEVKMNTLPRKRGPVAKPPIHNLFGPPQPTLAGGMDVDGGGREESGSVETTLGAGREEHEDGSEAEVANADIADLFAAVHASSSAAPTEPPEVFVPVFDRDDSLWDGRGDNTTEFLVPVFREVAEGVGSRLAALTSPRDSRGERGTMLASARASDSGLLARNTSVSGLLSRFEHTEQVAPQIRRRNTREVLPITSPGSSTDGRSGPSAAIISSANTSLDTSDTAVVHDGVTGSETTPAEEDTLSRARDGEPRERVVVPKSRFGGPSRYRAPVSSVPSQSHDHVASSTDVDADVPAWRRELLERRRRKKAEQERLAAQSHVLFGSSRRDASSAGIGVGRDPTATHTSAVPSAEQPGLETRAEPVDEATPRGRSVVSSSRGGSDTTTRHNPGLAVQAIPVTAEGSQSPQAPRSSHSPATGGVDRNKHAEETHGHEISCTSHVPEDRDVVDLHSTTQHDAGSAPLSGDDDESTRPVSLWGINLRGTGSKLSAQGAAATLAAAGSFATPTSQR